MNPAKGRRGGQDHNVAFLQAIHRILVAIKSDELAIFGNVDLLLKSIRKVLVARFHSLWKDVRHRNELSGPLRCGECI